jgi:hypothetical protein
MDYTALIARARVECNDTASSNPHFGETPTGVRDAANTVFRLLNPNPVAASIYYTYGATSRSQAGFTLLDGPSGYVSITAAPDAGVTQPFFFDYFSQWFLDADYQQMIDGATEDLGGVAGQLMDAGLNSALIQFVISRFWKRRASTYANQYASAAGGSSAAPESVSSQYLALAKAATSEGIRLMTAFYTRHGKRNAPASGTITNQISPYTPRR